MELVLVSHLVHH